MQTFKNGASFLKNVDMLKTDCGLCGRCLEKLRTFEIFYVITSFRTSSFLSKEKIDFKFFGASTVIQNDYLMVE